MKSIFSSLIFLLLWLDSATAWTEPQSASFRALQRTKSDSTIACGQDLQSTLSRRSALQSFGGLLSGLLLFDSTALAAEESPSSQKKPYAPLENLLPATRVKLLIDRSLALVEALQKEEDVAKKEELVAELKSLLLEPRSFLTKSEESKARLYLEIDTTTPWVKARQKEAQQQFLSESRDDPLTRLNEGFEQWGERRQFNRLQKQQLALEAGNPMRAAFNAYTNNLVFGDSYMLNASKEEKSRMIRQYNQLPDVTSVIRADLDLRDLYRNQILTSMDDARAELKYQIKSNDSDFSELLTVLKGAQSFCNKWFDFVPEASVKEAMEVVLAEKSS